MKHKMTRIHKNCAVMLVLFIQAGIFFLHAPCARSALSNQAQKLILGFEEAELSRGAHISREEKPGRQSWFYLLERPEGFDFAARFEWPGETNRAWTWNCRRGAHTEGKLALVTTVAPVNREKQTATYCQTKFLSYFYPNIRKGLVETRPLMTSFQWLVKARPDLRDFSDYDLLWVDLRCDAGPVELWLALEDNLLEPPVMRTYTIPAGTWITVEFDLKEMEQIKTNVHIGYIFIGTPPSNFSASIDLQRLSIQFCAWVFIIATLYFICESYKEDNNAEGEQNQ